MLHEISHARLRRRAEELANSITHGAGLGFSVLGFLVLVLWTGMRGGAGEVLACAIYGASLVAMYGASTWYHGSAVPKKKRWLRRLDHAAIYLLIAGSYTPFLATSLGGAFGWGLLAVVWACAGFGVALKLCNPRVPKGVSLGSYLFLGWISLVAIRPLYVALPLAGFALLVAGGIAYTAGVYFYARDSRRYHHAVWHLFVMAGSVLHYLAILFFVRPA